MRWRPTVGLAAAFVAFLTMTSATAWAQDEPVGTAPGAEKRPTEAKGETGPPVTQPLDMRFGEHQLSEPYHFPDPQANVPRVDRRDAVDASSDRSILMPTAHTPHQNTLAYSNAMLALNRLAFSPTDDLQLATTVVVPSAASDFHLGLSGKITLSESFQHVFSIQPLGFYHTGSSALATRDLGFGVAALVDLMVSNNLIVTLGGTGYATVWAGTEEFVYENCETREDFLDGSCREERTQSEGFPPGGHFLAAHLGVTWYITDQWSLRGEAMTGVASGSVLGTEWLAASDDPAAARERLVNGGIQAGMPYGSEATVGLGIGWSNGLFSAQFSGYVLRVPDQFADEEGDAFDRNSIWALTPMANVGIAVF